MRVINSACWINLKLVIKIRQNNIYIFIYLILKSMFNLF